MFDLQPTLRGTLLELRPLRADDFPELYAVASDPLIWEQHPIRDRYKEEVFKGFFADAMASGGALVALDVKDGRLIGSSRFHGYDQAKSEIEIGWTFLARSHWGGVYNGEMKSLMLTHAFKFVDNVLFRVGPQNLRSQRAVEKIGGVRAGTGVIDTGRVNLVFWLTRDRYQQLGSGQAVAEGSRIRLAVRSDLQDVARLFHALWPKTALEDHRKEAALILGGAPPTTTPLVVLVAEHAQSVIGFVEADLRSHADGCDPRQPVGYIEGWYVVPEHRQRGVGRDLLRAVEDWARAHGCKEMASDTWIDNEPSQRAHLALGFEVVDRCVNFKKRL